MLEWLRLNEAALWWAGALSVLTFVGSLVAIPLIIIRMRADYFVRPTPPRESWTRQHPALRATVLVLKNLLGLVLVIAGLGMLVFPGQGVLTILIGITLLNFPGKRTLELKIVRQRQVRRGINWIRRKADRPPLELPA